MPESWVRASMLVRCNSLVQGHSGVRFHIIQSIAELLNANCTPLVPLRGSISASGDLSPLSYIAGVLEGNPKLLLWSGCNHRGGCRRLVRADQLLPMVGIEPVSFGPKEGLGLINGTAVSAAVAALALHESHQLAVLSQMLTAMGVEVMLGSPESFDPFIAQVRPHAGQIECATNIRGFLQGSRLVHVSSGVGDANSSHCLRQDRYPLRTASQWMGPLLEDLMLAHQQVITELNATTDNPLIDVEARRTLHGGNFQAMSITVAMDKVRSSLQLMGKMMFAQCTEIINPDLNNGLPPNLCFDEPSLSYCLKGVDIAMAAYTSELGFLAHSVGPNVQSAEMSNQAINSLALVSTRYTQTATDVLSMLTASYLYVLCQGLDLRVLQFEFFNALQPLIPPITSRILGSFVPPATEVDLHTLIWNHIMQGLKSKTTKDSHDRFRLVAESTQSVIVTFFASYHVTAKSFSPPPSPPIDIIHEWTKEITPVMAEIFRNSQIKMLTACPTANYLGVGARHMYEYVRHTLRVPLHRGLVDHPTFRQNARVVLDATTATQEIDTDIIGSFITKIYHSLRSGELMTPVMDCLVQCNRNGHYTGTPVPMHCHGLAEGYL